MPIKTNVALIICLLGINCSSTKKAEKLQKAEENRNHFNSNKNLYKYIASTIQYNKADTIFDVASGFGFSSALLAENMPSNTIFYQEDINSALCSKSIFKYSFKFYNSMANINNFRFFKGTENTIPYPTNGCKNVTVFLSLHEFRQLENMLKEMHRIMHPNGKLYILETVYRTVLEKDFNCGKAYLKENLFYNLLKEQKFSIIKDTIVTDTDTSNVVGRYLICHKL